MLNIRSKKMEETILHSLFINLERKNSQQDEKDSRYFSSNWKMFLRLYLHKYSAYIWNTNKYMSPTIFYTLVWKKIINKQWGFHFSKSCKKQDNKFDSCVTSKYKHNLWNKFKDIILTTFDIGHGPKNDRNYGTFF